MLSDGGLTEDDEEGTHCRGRRSAAESLESQKHGRNAEDAADCREQAHRNIRHARTKVVLANVFEVKIAGETGRPAGQCDQELGEGRMDVHEELPLDILGREAAEVHLVEHDAGGLVDAE